MGILTSANDTLENGRLIVGAINNNGTPVAGFEQAIICIPSIIDMMYFPTAPDRSSIKNYNSYQMIFGNVQDSEFDFQTVSNTTRSIVPKQNVKIKKVSYWDLLNNHTNNKICLSNDTTKTPYAVADSVSIIENEWEYELYTADILHLHKHTLSFNSLILEANTTYYLPAASFIDSHTYHPYYPEIRGDYRYGEWYEETKNYGRGWGGRTGYSLEYMMPIELVIDIDGTEYTVFY